MSMDISTIIRSYQHTPNDRDFKTVYNYVLPDFRYWYRHAQRYVDMDRQTLLCEFQYILLRAIRRFNSLSPVTDAFLRYFRAAAKKHVITLRREARCSNFHSLQQDWDIVDPKSSDGTDYVEIMDVVHACFDGDERAIILSRLMGEQPDGVKKSTGISEFRYRAAVRNIKSSKRLRRSLSRD